MTFYIGQHLDNFGVVTRLMDSRLEYEEFKTRVNKTISYRKLEQILPPVTKNALGLRRTS